jgi:hypothetical protein
VAAAVQALLESREIRVDVLGDEAARFLPELIQVLREYWAGCAPTVTLPERRWMFRHAVSVRAVHRPFATLPGRRVNLKFL